MRSLSRSLFTGAVRALIKQHYPRVKFSDEAIRLLTLQLPQAESNASELSSLLSEEFTVLRQGGRRRIEVSHDGDSSSSDEETEPTETLAVGNYYVRSITNAYIRDGQRVYVTDWEAAEEPAANIPPTMVTSFNRHRRAWVCRAFIGDEAGHTRERRRPSAEAPSSRRRPHFAVYTGMQMLSTDKKS
ncbi:hypothetical protein GN244_ATG14129 [Phytophthora infestans]|uniref:Uncharacterized protein n=1 Tax=Phytophthora infestans TaxID=4787 RepID=A0A833WGR6_PHYIN|nr:hypothetical protein GN244_ATG14129 [Phytophthora infestans]